MASILGEIAQAAKGVGCTLTSDYRREDGYGGREPGMPPATEPYVDPEKPQRSRQYRHIISGNSSLALVTADGKVKLRLNYVPVAGQSGRDSLLDTLGKYDELSRALLELFQGKMDNEMGVERDSELGDLCERIGNP